MCATDAGREGELIFRLLIKNINSNKPIERLWISSMEDSAIIDGMNQLKDSKEYLNLYYSALARAKSDWLVGMNYSRLYSVSYNQNYAIGRVQTPTLAMIVNRDENIDNFKEEKHFVMILNTKTNSDEYIEFTSERFDDEEKYDYLISKYPTNISIISVDKEEKIVRSPRLHNLTSLQRKANKVFGYTAQQTLDYAQSLYEKKIITYPRTDSNYLSEDMEPMVSEILTSFSESYMKSEKHFKSLFNNSKVSDHHALIPTKYSVNNNLEIPKFEMNIYNLIKYRLLESISPDYRYVNTIIKSSIDDLKLNAKGKTIIEKGFKAIEERHKAVMNEEIKLPKIQNGDMLELVDIKCEERYTKPLKRYTEDTLLSAMENAGIEELNKNLEIEKKGLGTSATRAGIIEKLIKTGYIVRNKKDLISTYRGKSLIQIVDDKIKSPKTTAMWENKLTEIAEGNYSADEFINNVVDDIQENIQIFKSRKLI